MYYCIDRSGCIHFGRTPQEALRKAVAANREMR